MLYMIFQSDLEPVLIQRITIGFEAMLENVLMSIGSIITFLKTRIFQTGVCINKFKF